MSISTHFHNYVDNIMENRIAESDIFNGHTTFLMCNRDNREDIKNHRMNWLITNYFTYDCHADLKKDLKDVRDVCKDYYTTNISDNYTGNFDPPCCFYNYINKLNDLNREKIQKECEERYNDDIETHYRDISNKYDAISSRLETSENFEVTYDYDTYDTDCMSQSDVIEEYDEYDDYDDFSYYEEETDDNEEDYNDW